MTSDFNLLCAFASLYGHSWSRKEMTNFGALQLPDNKLSIRFYSERFNEKPEDYYITVHGVQSLGKTGESQRVKVLTESNEVNLLSIATCLLS